MRDNKKASVRIPPPSQALSADAGRPLILEGYRIRAPLQSSALGTIFAGVQQASARPVMVQIFRTFYSTNARDPYHLKRLQTCARRLKHLVHPRIVPILDSGATNVNQPDRPADTFFLVSAHVAGRTLEDALQTDSFLALREQGVMMALIEDILSAMEQAHQRGIVHGNLKPSSVLLVEEGHGRTIAKLTDFSFASLVRAETILLPGDVDNEFLAPEVLTGFVADERSDIYSLGVLLQRMLWYRSDVYAQTTSPFSPGVDFEQIIERCVRQDPNERFQSIPPLRALLTRFIAPQQRTDPRTPPPPLPSTAVVTADDEPPLPPPPRSRGWAAMAVFTTLLLFAVALSRPPPAPPPAVTAQPLVEVAAEPESHDAESYTMRSTPAGAEVWEGETLLGHTPMTLTAQHTPRTFSLRLQGHQPHTLAWTPPAEIPLITLSPLAPIAVAKTPTPAPRRKVAAEDGLDFIYSR